MGISEDDLHYILRLRLNVCRQIDSELYYRFVTNSMHLPKQTITENTQTQKILIQTYHSITTYLCLFVYLIIVFQLIVPLEILEIKKGSDLVKSKILIKIIHWKSPVLIAH